jgi:hypothetical protein
MTEELQLPPFRRADPQDLLRQGQAMAELVKGVPPRSRLRRWLVSLGVGGVVVATAGAGVAYLAAEPAKDRTGAVHCFTGPKLNTQDGGTSTNYSGRPADAIAACALLWQNAILQLGAGSPLPPSTPAQVALQPVPHLVACVYQDVAAVFPGDADLCQRLGLPPLKK